MEDTMNPINILLVIFGIIGSSVGFWGWLGGRKNKKNYTEKLMMGIAHEHIVGKGMAYIQRGYMTAEEYKVYFNYFYEPYKAMGGNGLAEKVFNEVQKLPMHSRRADPNDTCTTEPPI